MKGNYRTKELSRRSVLYCAYALKQSNEILDTNYNDLDAIELICFSLDSTLKATHGSIEL